MHTSAGMDWTSVDWKALGDVMSLARRELRLHSWDALAERMGISLSTMKNLRTAIESGEGSFRQSTAEALEQLALDAGLSDAFYDATGLAPRRDPAVEPSGRATSAGQGLTQDQDRELLERILDKLEKIENRLDERGGPGT